MRFATPLAAFGFILLLIAAIAAGCGQENPRPVPLPCVGPEPARTSENSLPASLLDLPPATAEAAEYWDEVYLQGTKVGTQQTTIKPESKDGKTLLRTTSTLRMALKRGRDVIRQEIVSTSLDDLDGRLIEFEITMNAGPTPIVTRGVPQSDKLNVSITVQGRATESSLPWNEKIGGLFAVDQSLARQPLKVGEKRQLKLLTPGLAGPEIVEAQIEAVAEETPGLIRHTIALVRADKTRTDFVCIVDAKGQTIRQSAENGLQETRRVTREAALAGAGEANFDLLSFSIVKAALPVPQPHATKKAVYRIKLKGNDPAKIFPQGATQQVTAVDAQTADVTVTSLRAATPATVDARGDRQPNAADVQPNSLIESDDAAVKAMAAAVPAEITDPAQLAAALEKLVRSNMKLRNYSQAFATAAQVAKSHEGDCTEHAVLLAALLRARNIPARVALGLVYYPEGGGFAFHMWTEAWINGRWVPFDATLARGGIGAAHIKVSDSALAGTQATSALLPVMKLLGQMEIEVRSIE